MPLPNLKSSVALASLTSLGVGGPARHYVRASTLDQLRASLLEAREAQLPVYVLGGGSNLLVADAGVPGVVLQAAILGHEVISEDDATVCVRVNAGEDWDRFVAESVACGWAGLECLSGIPGWVGAAPIQNIGAYGQEVSQVIESVEVMDLKTGALSVMPNAACEFSYRSSVFKTRLKGKSAVVAVTFRLSKLGPAPLRYQELLNYFEGSQAPLTTAKIRQAVLTVRAGKSMLFDPSDPNGRSAGSFFTNPILEKEAAQALQKKAGASMPLYAYGDRYKTSAAWLIEHSGYAKGHVRGGAALSSKHALAIINPGAATADDLIGLARAIQESVLAQWGVLLEAEPQLWGFSTHPLLKGADRETK